ncbi:alpha-N-acetylglucosaminidase C-terminal domain-containing protein [Bacteroides pyogenes]|uniref:alpha-N-acetylglucosaminidase C-terminal domain-containing protein n=1 Tax=Bacteroides pyogenes TaxID=310300 RepID=UPI001E2F56FF
MVSAYKAAGKKLFEAVCGRFLNLIRLQDKLLATRREFRLGTWINFVRNGCAKRFV